MNRLHQRVGIPLVIASFILFVYIIGANAPKDSVFYSEHHFFDSLAHMYQEPEGRDKPPVYTNDPKPQPQSSQSPTPVPEPKEEIPDPCTVHNPFNHGFISLRGLSSLDNEGKALPWQAKGYDSGHNFTIGICSNPFKKSHDGLNEIQDNLNASNIGGYYVDPQSGQYVSIGEFSTTPKFVGNKLTLKYENGAYCENLANTKTGERARRSTILKFTCDREMMAKAAVSYVGSFEDCSYIFEVRSHYACPTAAKGNDLAVIWIFLLILLAALFVYFSGGLLYKQMKAKKPPKRILG